MEELENFGVKPIFLDITKDESIVACIDQIKKEAGYIDILINSAGSGYYGALEDMPIADAKYQLDVNLFGAARLMQLVLPDMRKKNTTKL